MGVYHTVDPEVMDKATALLLCAARNAHVLATGTEAPITPTTATSTMPPRVERRPPLPAMPAEGLGCGKEFAAGYAPVQRCFNTPKISLLQPRPGAQTCGHGSHRCLAGRLALPRKDLLVSCAFGAPGRARGQRSPSTVSTVRWITWPLAPGDLPNRSLTPAPYRSRSNPRRRPRIALSPTPTPGMMT